MDGRRIGRNDPCPCGSGRKYKQCCHSSGRFQNTAMSRPRGVFGEGTPPLAPTRQPPPRRPPPRQLPAVRRVSVDYTFPEPFGNAEVNFCFEVGRLAQLEGGFVVTVERLQPGMRFILDNGAVATVTAVGTPKVWEPPPAEPDEDGNYQRRVIGRIKHTGFMVLDLTFGGLTVTTTPGHLFYSLDRRGWVGAETLHVGEALLNDKGERLRLDGKSRIRHGFVELYNIEVEQHHTYFVGRERGNSALAHNGVGGPGGPGYIPGPANPQGPVPRVGTARPGVVETPLSGLHPLHPVPRSGMPPNHITDLATAIRTNGYDVGRAIPVVRMPDGRLVQLGGHHRAAAMAQLGETTIPARITDWASLPAKVQNWWMTRFPNFPW